MTQRPNNLTPMSRQTRRQTIFVFVFLIVVLLFVMTFRLGAVRGESMQPTYVEGQAVLVLRRNWLNSGLKRGDVVLVKHGRDVLIKRIYRLPGEEIDGRVTAFLRNSSIYDLSDYYEQVPNKAGEPRLLVPQGFVVLLGDNPRASEDSRQFGPVPIRDIIGTVVNAPPPPVAEPSPRSLETENPIRRFQPSPSTAAPPDKSG
jgi:signal peptidase I